MSSLIFLVYVCVGLWSWWRFSIRAAVHLRDEHPTIGMDGGDYFLAALIGFLGGLFWPGAWIAVAISGALRAIMEPRA